MWIDRRSLILAGCSLLLLRPTPLGASPPVISGSITAPFDHETPGSGTFELGYEWARSDQPDAPTVLVVADGQQFYTRPGAAARLQQELFGPRLNVLVPFGRGRAPALHERLSASGATDWALAHQLLKREQWVADLELLVTHLRLRERPLFLYGRSGGGYLIYEWLVARPEPAQRVYVQAAVNPELDVHWGLGADRTWDALRDTHATLATELLGHLARHPDSRPTIVRLLQRQNFFVPLDRMDEERAALVTAFLRNDGEALAGYRRTYQLDALDALAGTIEGVASTVRLFEFAAPRQDPRASTDRLLPDVELLFDQAHSLVELAKAGRIASPLRDWSRLSLQKAEVLQIAGRYDHTADYRTQIGLEAAVPSGRLLIFRDDHRLSGFTASGRQPKLLQAFFAGGSTSSSFRAELEGVGDLLWRGQG